MNIIWDITLFFKYPAYVYIERERKRGSVCVCVCERERERERERDIKKNKVIQKEESNVKESQHYNVSVLMNHHQD